MFISGAILGLLAFHIGVTVDSGRQRVKQRQTLTIIRDCSRIAINENYEIPQQSFAELTDALSTSCTVKDAWGNPLSITVWKDKKAMHFRIASSGKDGSLVHTDLRQFQPGIIEDYNADIVFEDNRFIQFPRTGC